MNVPCNGCTACCRQSIPRVLDRRLDDVSRYKLSATTDGTAVLATKPNGDCYYLGKQGCTIYNDRPFMCRHFDCREVYNMLTEKQRDEIANRTPWTKPIFEAAKERL